VVMLKIKGANVYILVLIIYTLLGSIYLNNIYKNLQITFNIGLFTINLIIFFAIFGFLLGLENSIKELFKKSGSLRFNIFKLLVSSILFILITSYILTYLSLIPNQLLLKYNNIYTVILQSLFWGYSLTLVFNKV